MVFTARLFRFFYRIRLAIFSEINNHYFVEIKYSLYIVLAQLDPAEQLVDNHLLTFK